MRQPEERQRRALALKVLVLKAPALRVLLRKGRRAKARLGSVTIDFLPFGGSERRLMPEVWEGGRRRSRTCENAVPFFAPSGLEGRFSALDELTENFSVPCNRIELRVIVFLGQLLGCFVANGQHPFNHVKYPQRS